MARLATLVALGLMLLPADAWACSCSGPRNAVEAHRAQLVIRGRVVRVQYRDVPLPAPDFRGPFLEPVEVEFEVARSWRGRATVTTLAYTGMGGGDCGYPFSVGFDYVVPLYAAEHGELVTGLCAGVQPVWEARATVRELGPGHAPVLDAMATVSKALVSGPWAQILWLYSVVALFVLACLGVGLYGPRALSRGSRSG